MHYSGGSSGVGFRVARGVYVRTGGFRVRHDRIVSYTPMEDGFSLTRDRANARPEMFRTGDGWFTYNIVANAQNLES